ncbi:MAG: Rha family transcriptional regulator [Rhodocyclaceae bacterium]|nr:Rha family transcriptional regulator [Rhodocyclaceae bacterium]
MATKNKTAARLESGAAAESKNEQFDLTAKPTTNPLLTVIQDVPRIDSRVLAESLGNTHRATFALIERYLSECELHGQVLFKKAVGERRQGGGKSERIALLNEDQCFFVLSLSRNTARVVSLKSKLVTAFARARREAAMRQNEYLPEYHHLHDAIKEKARGSENERFVHSNFNRLVNKVAGIEAGQRSTAPVATLTIVNHVALLAMADAVDHHDAYRLAKAALEALQPLLTPAVKGIAP